MKYVKTAVLFNMFLLIVVPASLSIASTSLSFYEANFEVVANQKNEFRDVRVKLKITYHIDNKLKTGGMKFVEAKSIEAVQVTDGDGRPLKFQVSRRGKGYHKISWSFPGISKGEQVVIVRFNLPDVISVAGGKNYFRAYWVGSWVVPVGKALYRFVFPTGYSYKVCSVYPQYKYKEEIVEEKRQIEVPIVPLKDESFALAFSPSFTEWRETEKADSMHDSINKTEYLPEKSEEREREPLRIVLENIPEENDVQSEEEFPKEWDERGQKPDITEKEVSQLVPAAPEGKIEEEKIKDEKVEERTGGEVNAVQEETITGEGMMVLSVSTTTTTSKVPHKRKVVKRRASEDEKRIYDSARELFRQERYKEALSNLRYFMDLYPRSELAGPLSFLIGECYFHLAKEGDIRSYQPAVDAFELALALYPDSKEVPRGLLHLANSYREMKYYYEAEGNYEVLIYKYPDARCIPDAFFWMAENCFQNDEPGEAKDKFQNFMVRYPKKDPLKLKRASFRIADCYAALKDYGRAQKGYEDALDRWPAYPGLFPETLFYMGLTYFKNGDYDKALSLLFTALNVFPEQEYNHILLTKIGDAYQKQGEVEEALKVYAQNSVLYPESEGALISEIKMADIGVKKPGFFNFDQYLEPLLVYERIIEKYPTTELAEEALYKQGFAFSEQKRHQEAITSLMKVLQEYPDSDLSKKCASSLQEILCKLVNSYFADKKYYFILELYRKYREPYFAECTNTLTFFQIGESLRQTGCYGESLEMYEKAQRIYPREHPEDELILRMGEVYLLKKEYAQAEKMFKKMINNFPGSRFRDLASHALADTYYEQERYGDARLAYLSALGGEQKTTRNIKGFFYLGKCYQAAGKISLAVDAYKSAIQVAEDFERDQVEQEFIIKSYFQLADCLYQNQQYMDAIGVYTQVAEKYPEDDRTKWALYRIATSYRKMGKDKVDTESLKELAKRGSEDTFWEKVVSGGIRNLEWEVKNRENLVP